MALTQNELNKRWESKNRERSNYIKSKGSAKSFILNKATKEDLEWLKELIDARILEL